MHEHVMVDFGAELAHPQRWDRDEVTQVMLPHLQEIVRQGVNSLVECTPAFLGRDPLLLEELSRLTGLHIITNTGLYKEPYLPRWAIPAEPKQLAERWVREFHEGIDGSQVRPGFVKIALNPGGLLPVQRTIVRAAALTHRATGLVVMAHAGELEATRESLDLIEAEGMSPGRFIVAHADQMAADIGPQDPAWSQALEMHEELLKRGAWLEYDGLGYGDLERPAQLLAEMIDRGYERQLLISQDAGWYHVGEPSGGTITPMTRLLDDFLPALRRAGLGADTLGALLIDNPASALAIG